MVKNKKMSKSAIAIIVLSLLLVLSMVLGLTGAWFTDSKSGSANTSTMKFGTVAIALDTETGAGQWSKLGLHEGSGSGAVVPGSEYNATWTLSNSGTEDVYYKITSSSISLTIGGHVMSAAELEEAGITIQYKLGEVVMPAAEANFAQARRLNSGASVDVTVVLDFPVSMGNSIGSGESEVVFNTKGAANSVAVNLAYAIEVDAIQVANYDPATGNELSA